MASTVYRSIGLFMPHPSGYVVGLDRLRDPSSPESIYPGRASHRPVTGMECARPARLDDRQLDEIRRFEERLGVVLVGYERLPPYRQLSPEELERLRSIERETGSILVAYETPTR